MSIYGFNGSLFWKLNQLTNCVGCSFFNQVWFIRSLYIWMLNLQKLAPRSARRTCMASDVRFSETCRQAYLSFCFFFQTIRLRRSAVLFHFWQTCKFYYLHKDFSVFFFFLGRLEKARKGLEQLIDWGIQRCCFLSPSLWKSHAC